MILVEKAPPFATVQDMGWLTGRAMGLPKCGAMDPLLLGRANSLVGNLPGAAGIEWALGPGVLRAGAACELTVLGAGKVLLNDEPADMAHPVWSLDPGERVTIAPDPDQRFLYVAVRGGIAVPEIMGSRSTYLPGGFGGFEGRRLKAGDLLPVGQALHISLGGLVHPRAAPDAGAEKMPIRVTRGPQWDRFDEAARRTLLESRFRISASSDRMGYRLEGPAIVPSQTATLPSEAACPGAIQIPDGGAPIVLMPDGPTVGGYPKIAVVMHADLRCLAQYLPGREVRFREAG